MHLNIKKINNRDIIGLLLLIGPIQFILSVLIAEGIAINYNSAKYYVSSLGVGVTAPIFNLSVMILGLCMIACAYFFQKEYNKMIPSILLLITGMCAFGVGLFPENIPPYHGIFTGFVFLFAAIFLISSIKIEKSPFIVILTLLGVLVLISSFILFPYLGLEIESELRFLGFMKGTLERFIIYLTLTAFLGLGGYLSRKTENGMKLETYHRNQLKS